MVVVRCCSSLLQGQAQGQGLGWTERRMVVDAVADELMNFPVPPLPGRGGRDLYSISSTVVSNHGAPAAIAPSVP